MVQLPKGFDAAFDKIQEEVRQISSNARTHGFPRATCKQWVKEMDATFHLSDIEKALEALENTENAERLSKRLSDLDKAIESGSIKADRGTLIQPRALLDLINKVAGNSHAGNAVPELSYSLGHFGLITPRRNEIYQVETNGVNAEGHLLLV